MQLKRPPTTKLRRLPMRSAMCDYVVRLTTDATHVTPEYHEKMRAVGFNDTAILQITLIASWFNYINSVADALGAGRN